MQLNRTLLGVGISVVLSGQALAAEILVDSFEHTYQQLELPKTALPGINLPNEGSLDNVRDYAPEALGDDRDLTLFATNVQSPETATAVVNGSNGAGLWLDRSASVTGMTTTVLWDGNGLGLKEEQDNEEGQNRTSFDGDITSRGTNDGLLIGLPFAVAIDLYVRLNLRSGSEVGPVSWSLMPMAAGGDDLFFPFLEFEPEDDLVGLADLTDLFSIEMVLSEAAVATVVSDAAASSPAEALSAMISFVKATPDPNNPSTPVPLPATLPLLLGGLITIRLVGGGRAFPSP